MEISSDDGNDTIDCYPLGEGEIKKILEELEGFSGGSTLREFLKGLSLPEIQAMIRLHDLLRIRLWPFLGCPQSLLLDLDSTVLSLTSFSIEGAKRGYNPIKRGLPSYHPLLCFAGYTLGLWHGILREGNASTLTGIEEFWQACLPKIPSQLYRVRVRADAGFFSHQFVERLEERSIGYAIVAKMTKPIREKIRTLHYEKFQTTPLQTAQFWLQPQHWEKPQRFIVVRRPQSHAEQDNQLTL